jgi:TIR domain
MNPVKCPVCRANAVGSPYPDRDVHFIECPACGAFDVPKTTDLLILRELSQIQRAVLSFWLRHEARGKTPLVLTDELTKRVIKEKKLPDPDEQEENVIQAVGKTLESGEQQLAVDLRYFASEIGAPNEAALRELVARLLEKGILNGIRNVPMVTSGEVNEVRLGLTPDGVRKYRELRTNSAPNHYGQSTKVFLSHAAADEHIALLLKAEIEGRLTGVKVFCSSDPTDLPPGTKWSPAIQQALRESAMLIFVASERGLQRPWVWFECGTFWFTGKKIMPLCLGDVRKNTLHPPLSELQAINGDEPSELKTALEVIAAATGSTLSDVSDLDNLCEKLKQLDREAAAVLSAASGWVGADWNGRFLAYDGPYESLKEIGNRNFETSMQQALKAAGYNVALYDKNNFAAMGDTNHFVWLTDRKSWRCRVAKGAAYLVATPA